MAQKKNNRREIMGKNWCAIKGKSNIDQIPRR